MNLAFAGFRHPHVVGLYNKAKVTDIVNVTGCFEENEDAKKIAESNGVEFNYTSYEEILNDKNVEAIAIGDYYGKRGKMVIDFHTHIFPDKIAARSIIHLENADLQEFDGSYTEYRCSILKEKLKLKLQNVEEQEEIARTQEMVDILRRRATLMVNPVIGSAVNAKQSQLDRLIARQIKPPFIEVKEPEIVLPELKLPEISIPDIPRYR